MHAVIYERYGGVDELRVADVPPPTARRGEVLVRVHAAALNPKDALFRKGRYRLISGTRFPKLVGVDFAGEVVDTGERVFGALQELRYRRGTLAEQVAVRHEEMAPMPADISYEEAAGLPLAGLTALQALRDVAQTCPGDAVCVNGGSGGVGTLAIQIARALGATVTSVSSAANVSLCRELGAQEALAYDGDRPWERTEAYRVVFDAYGNLSFARVHAALQAGGIYVSTVPSMALVGDLLRGRRARIVVVRSRRSDLAELARLVAAGSLQPVIDRIVDLADVREAFGRLESRRTRGKIVIRIAT
jgi:NADPH:quinone reductase-like Zn-dependent oxidoreductase